MSFARLDSNRSNRLTEERLPLVDLLSRFRRSVFKISASAQWESLIAERSISVHNQTFCNILWYADTRFVHNS